MTTLIVEDLRPRPIENNRTKLVANSGCRMESLTQKWRFVVLGLNVASFYAGKVFVGGLIPAAVDCHFDELIDAGVLVTVQPGANPKV